MNRRVFLSLGAVLSTASAFFGFFGHRGADRWQLLQSMQNHLFPGHDNFPSSEDVRSVRYLKMVSRDRSFDQKDLQFIFEGVDELVRRGWRDRLSRRRKEEIMQQFAATTFGSNWIATVLNYTFEALLGDPIYGGNMHQRGWKALRHHPGIPRPKVPFGRLS